MQYRWIVEDYCKEIQSDIMKWHEQKKNLNGIDGGVTKDSLNVLRKAIESRKRFVDGVCYIYKLEPPSSYYTPTPPKIE